MTLPQPYFQDDAVTIYHADCRDLLPELKADLVLTDPPYGIEGGRGGTSRLRGRGNYEGAFTPQDDTPEFIRSVVVSVIQQCIDLAAAVIVTPGNKNFSLYPQPESFGAMFQPASTGAQHWGNADAQPIFYYGRNPRAGKWMDGGYGRCSWRVTERVENNGHPCPKPFIFWKHLVVKGSVEGDTILDPFMGSGTTLRAAKDLGRRAIGIEIEERYCEIAAKRMSQGVLL